MLGGGATGILGGGTSPPAPPPCGGAYVFLRGVLLSLMYSLSGTIHVSFCWLLIGQYLSHECFFLLTLILKLQVLIAQSYSAPKGKERGGAKYTTVASSLAATSSMGGPSSSTEVGKFGEGSCMSDESDSDSSYSDSNDSDDEASNSNGSSSGPHSMTTCMPQRGKQSQSTKI